MAVSSCGAARWGEPKEQDLHDWYAVLNTLSSKGKTSMLQDIEAGRKTEVEIFAGKVVDLGKSTDPDTR